MMTRTLLVLACLSSPASADLPTAPMYVGVYQILSDHPECNAPGQVAIEVKGRQDVVIEYFPASLGYEGKGEINLPVCTIKTRKGGNTVEEIVACADEDARKKAERTELQTFCKTVDQLPVKSTFGISLNACLSVDGLKILEGSWGITSDSSFSPYRVTGDFEGFPTFVQYVPERDQRIAVFESVVKLGTTTMPAHLDLRVVSEAFELPDLPEMKLGAAATLDLYLVEQTRRNCEREPTDCFSTIEPIYNEGFREFAEVMSSIGESIFFEVTPGWEIIDYGQICDDK